MLFFQKKCILCFLSLALALCRSQFSRWLLWSISYFLFFSVSVSLFLYSKFVDMAINLNLILQTTRIQKQLPLSFFVFIDSLVASASQYSGGYAISRQNNLELHLGCHTCWLSYLSYFTLVCLWCGRTVARSGGVACKVESLRYF